VNVLSRALADIRARRNIDTYVAVTIAAIFAALGIVGDIVPDGLKWSALFAGLGILLFRVALPARPATPIEHLLADRTTFEGTPFSSLLVGATQVWIFGPSAVNILNAHNCNAMRRTVLDRSSGEVRIAVLDPAEAEAVALAVRQLDQSLEYPVQDFEDSLATSVALLRRMASWRTAGAFGYRFVPYNPGFSMVAIDPLHRHGRLIIEFHGYRNEAVGSRMHLTLSRHDSDRWFQYWVQQFEALWTAASPQA
jgi:hypothetical protein